MSATDVSRRGGVFRRLALASASVVLVLLLAEALARLAPRSQRFLSAEEVWCAQAIDPGAALFRSGAAVSRDGLEIAGVTYRDEPLPQRAFAPGARRLLFLGDSFTVGWGLERREERFTDLVETELGPEQQGGLYAFNAARGGSNPDQWAGYLEALLPAIDPHAVIAVFFLRDGTSLGTSLQLNREEIDPIHQRTRARPLYTSSALFAFFWDRLAWREYSALFTAKLKRAYLGSHAERATWRRQQEALLAMAARCRAEGRPFHLVIFPLLFDLDGYAFHDVESEIARFAERNGIRVYPLTPVFLGRVDSELWVASNDQHPNALGHRIAAERLLPYLREVLLAVETRR